MFFLTKASTENEINVQEPTSKVSAFTQQSEFVPSSETSKEKTNSALSKEAISKDSNSISSKDSSK